MRKTLKISIVFLLFLLFFPFAKKVDAIQIRQEINILDGTITGAAASNSNEIVQLDTTQYMGTVSYYFEAVISGAASNTGTVTLRRNGTTTDDASLAGRTTATLTRVRSTAFTPPVGITKYMVRNNADGTRSQTIKAARIIIIQNTTSLNSTQTQIEIGNNETAKTNTGTPVALTNPKYWTYTASKWDGIQTYSAEVTYSTSTTNTTTISLQQDDGNWNFSNLITIVNGVSNTTPTLAPRVTFNPTDGRHYRIAAFTSANNYSIYNAKIIVNQIGADTSGITYDNATSANTSAGSPLTFSFTTGSLTNGILIVGVAARVTVATGVTYNNAAMTFIRQDKPGADVSTSLWYLMNPASGAHNVVVTTDNTNAEIQAGAVSFSNVNALGNNAGTGVSTVTQATASVPIVAPTNQLIIDVLNLQANMSGLAPNASQTQRWITNIGVDQEAASSTKPGSGSTTMDWSWTGNQPFALSAVALRNIGSFTKLEPQYLILNTADSGSTGLQSYQQQWNASEWSGGAYLYTYSQDATNSADSSKLTDITASSDIANATVTGANQQIAGTAFTMPVDTHEFDVNVTNTTGVVTAGRILVMVNTAPPSQVVFTNTARTLTAGNCNGAGNVLTIQIQDTTNAPAAPTGSTVIRITSTSPSYTIYSDNTCSTVVTNGDFTFTTSDHTKSVYIIDLKSSSWTLTATKQSGPDTITSATQAITVNPNVLYSYSVSVTSPQVAGTCFTGTNTITALDQYNNTRTTDTSVVNMTTSGTSLTFYSSAGCIGSTTQYTMSSGQATVYIQTPKKQSGITVTATRNGGTETGSSSSLTVSPGSINTILVRLPGQVFTDGTGISSSSNFTGLRTPNATAGVSYTVDLKAVDVNNNLVDSGGNNYNGTKTIDFSSSIAGNAPDTTVPSFPSSSVSFTNGSANSLTITYYNAATGRTVQANDTGTPITGTASTTFIVQANALNKYAISAVTPETAGVAFNVTIVAADQWSNGLGSLYTAPSGTYIWSSTAHNAPDTTAPVIGTVTQANFVNGVATKSVTLYKAESVTFTASEPTPSTITGTTSSLIVNPGSISADVNDSLITNTTPVRIYSYSTLTITLKDTWRNPVSGVPVNNIVLSGTPTVEIAQTVAPTDVNGVTTGQIQWRDIGTKTVYVAIQNQPLVQNDGITADVDGKLDTTVNVVVTNLTKVNIKEGTVIRGGSKIGQ